MTSALDEFLDLCDADPDYDSGEDEDDPFERFTRDYENDKKKAKHEQEENEKGFHELFGSPVTIRQKTESEHAKTNSLASQEHSQKKSFFERKHSTPAVGGVSFTPKPDDFIIVSDPYTRLRLFKNSIQLYSDDVQTLDLSLKERNLTVPYTPLEKVVLIKDKGQFWTSGVLVRKVPGVRKSAKGNDYTLWEISDLNSAETTTLFLFGNSAIADSLKFIPIGSLVDLINPSLLHESQSGVVPKVKLSVSLSSQIRHIGTAKDFGFCSSKRKDGKDCTNVVNKFKCDVCIHHASAELRKLNSGKGKGKWAKKGFTEFEKQQFAARMNSPSENVITIDYGKSKGKYSSTASSSVKPMSATSGGSVARSDTSKSIIRGKPSIRMELQDPSNTMRMSPATFGNHSSITFSKDTSPLINTLPKDDGSTKVKKDLNLDPLKTRHLTDRDRVLLDRLNKLKAKSDLPAMLIDPNAGSKNFLKYLSNHAECNNQQKTSTSISSANTSKNVSSTSTLPGPIIMTRETLMNMQKALSFVKKRGPIQRNDPNEISKKRKLFKVELEVENPLPEDNVPCSSSSLQTTMKSKVTTTCRTGTSKSSHGEIDINSEEFEKILNAKSSHSSIAEENQKEEYFNKLERKEAIENKLLSTFSLATTAVMCRECKYIALSQSDFCKDKMHSIRVVKAVKRFFKCKDCGNRTMSLDRLPRRPCTHCKSSHWLPAPVGKERPGPTLDSERLVLRGDEEMFLGSTSAKLFL